MHVLTLAVIFYVKYFNWHVKCIKILGINFAQKFRFYKGSMHTFLHECNIFSSINK